MKSYEQNNDVVKCLPIRKRHLLANNHYRDVFNNHTNINNNSCTNPSTDPDNHFPSSSVTNNNEHHHTESEAKRKIEQIKEEVANELLKIEEEDINIDDDDDDLAEISLAAEIQRFQHEHHQQQHAKNHSMSSELSHVHISNNGNDKIQRKPQIKSRRPGAIQTLIGSNLHSTTRAVPKKESVTTATNRTAQMAANGVHASSANKNNKMNNSINRNNNNSGKVAPTTKRNNSQHQNNGGPGRGNRSHKHEASEDEEPLYCICRQPYTQNLWMIACDVCNDWFHGKCIGITAQEARKIKTYVCQACRIKYNRDIVYKTPRKNTKPGQRSAQRGGGNSKATDPDEDDEYDNDEDDDVDEDEEDDEDEDDEDEQHKKRIRQMVQYQHRAADDNHHAAKAETTRSSPPHHHQQHHATYSGEQETATATATATTKKINRGISRNRKRKIVNSSDESITIEKIQKKRRGAATRKNDAVKGENDKSSEGSSNDDDEGATIDCICGSQSEDGGVMVQCDKCSVWLHCACLGFTDESIPESFICPRCTRKPKEKLAELLCALENFEEDDTAAVEIATGSSESSYPTAKASLSSSPPNSAAASPTTTTTASRNGKATTAQHLLSVPSSSSSSSSSNNNNGNGNGSNYPSKYSTSNGSKFASPTNNSSSSSSRFQLDVDERREIFNLLSLSSNREHQSKTTST